MIDVHNNWIPRWVARNRLKPVYRLTSTPAQPCRLKRGAPICLLIEFRLFIQWIEPVIWQMVAWCYRSYIEQCFYFTAVALRQYLDSDELVRNEKTTSLIVWILTLIHTYNTLFTSMRSKQGVCPCCKCQCIRSIGTQTTRYQKYCKIIHKMSVVDYFTSIILYCIIICGVKVEKYVFNLLFLRL